MKVLVTGGTGLLGHRIAELLVQAGHEVTALVRDPGRAADILTGVELRRGDITDARTVEPAMEDVEWVFHAAGMPEQWQKDDRIFDRVNRGGTATVLEAARNAGVKRAVYTSTMDVFDAPEGGTLVETRLATGDKPTAYERSKVAADREAERIREEGLEVVHICPAAIYGPGPVNVGLNSFFIKLLNRQSPVLPPGGMPVVYVDGCARAHIAAAEVGTSGERYLVADTHVTNEELAREILAQSDLRRVPPTAPRWLMRGVAKGGERVARMFDVTPLIAEGQLELMQWNVRVNNGKARRELGFKPTPLADGIALTIAHLRKEGLVP
jgi:nucleoside-diphosphate-sugar epimerase